MGGAAVKGLTKLGATPDGHGRPGAGASDRIERVPRRARTAWDAVLVWFMRAVALVWLGKGVLAWSQILDAVPGAVPFEALAPGQQAVIVYFAVMDLTAAVGLWLTSAWGGVVWLLAATSALTLALLAPTLLPTSPVVITVYASIVVGYFILSWLSAQEAQ